MKNLTGCLLALFLFSYCKTTSQHDTWCQSQCNAAGDEKTNTELIQKIRENIDPNDESFGDEILTFPLRVSIVTDQAEPIYVDKKLIGGRINHIGSGHGDGARLVAESVAGLIFNGRVSSFFRHV